MRCDRALAALSARIDEPLDQRQERALRQHLAGCPACGVAERRMLELRLRLRVEPLGSVPDLTGRVVAELEARAAQRDEVGGTRLGVRRLRRGAGERSLHRAVAVAFVAGLVAGASFIGLNLHHPPQVVAADVGAEILAAQSRLQTLSADVTVVERGWAPQVPVRSFTGSLRYAAPESLSLQLTDLTRYPSSGWRRNDVAMVVSEAQWWASGFPGCPPAAEPGCEPYRPRVQTVIDREPFATDSPSALDLVLPVSSFDVPGTPTALPARQIAGRTAIGVGATVAQLAPLIGGLEEAGNWRTFYPADPAELWLDQGSLVPLEVTVRAAAGPNPTRWGAEHGYHDPAGAVLLQVDLTRVEVNRPLPADAFPGPPPGTLVRDAGFHAGVLDATWPAPHELPAGLRPYREGIVSQPGGTPVASRTWTDGRSWVEVAETRSWRGGALFGDLGAVVRRVQSGPSGVLFLGENGDRVGVHGDGIDLVVRGSLTGPQLLDIARSTGVVGRDVPAGWAEAGNATIAAASRAEPGLLVPARLRAFLAPGVRIAGPTVVLDYAGPGTLSLRITESPGSALTPPLDPDPTSLLVRGMAGRYQEPTGELEWVEAGTIISLRSETLTLQQLVGIADLMAPVQG